jgi:hypothetical protein
MTFVLLGLVMIQFKRLSALVNPKINPGMPAFEHAHAFQVVKSALKQFSVDKRFILNAISTQLNCSTIVDGLIFDWRCLFNAA